MQLNEILRQSFSFVLHSIEFAQPRGQARMVPAFDGVSRRLPSSSPKHLLHRQRAPVSPGQVPGKFHFPGESPSIHQPTRPLGKVVDRRIRSAPRSAECLRAFAQGRERARPGKALRRGSRSQLKAKPGRGQCHKWAYRKPRRPPAALPEPNQILRRRPRLVVQASVPLLLAKRQATPPWRPIRGALR